MWHAYGSEGCICGGMVLRWLMSPRGIAYEMDHRSCSVRVTVATLKIDTGARVRMGAVFYSHFARSKLMGAVMADASLQAGNGQVLSGSEVGGHRA